MNTAIFDWDGTLAHIDDRELYCINVALKNNGYPTVDWEFYVKNYYERAYEIGTGPRMVLAAASSKASPGTAQKIYDTYRTTFQETVDKAELQPGALDLLKKLNGRRFKVGVATMRYTHSTVESELKHLKVSKFIQLLFTRGDLGIERIRGLPVDSLEEIVDQRARLITKSLNGLEASVSDAFLVGDSWWDVRAGKTIGIRTILVRTGFSMYNDFSKEMPDYTVSSLLELGDILEKKQWQL